MLEGNEDVMEMAKRMAGCTVADGHVIIRTVAIKHLQALVQWICDHQKQGLDGC